MPPAARDRFPCVTAYLAARDYTSGVAPRVKGSSLRSDRFAAPSATLIAGRLQKLNQSLIVHEEMSGPAELVPATVNAACASIRSSKAWIVS